MQKEYQLMDFTGIHRLKRNRKTRCFFLLFSLFLFSAFCSFFIRSCNLPANKPHFPFEPHFSVRQITLKTGNQYKLKIKGILLNQKITYQSAHSTVASVSLTGTVRAWKKGSTVITATLHGTKERKIYCIVFVN